MLQRSLCIFVKKLRAHCGGKRKYTCIYSSATSPTYKYSCIYSSATSPTYKYSCIYSSATSPTYKYSCIYSSATSPTYKYTCIYSSATSPTYKYSCICLSEKIFFKKHFVFPKILLTFIVNLKPFIHSKNYFLCHVLGPTSSTHSNL